MNERINAIFDAAKKYTAGAESLSNIKNDYFHLPAVLCASFGIELLLKCLLSIQDEKSGTEITKSREFKTHTFSDLFALLSRENQDVLIGEYRRISGKNNMDSPAFSQLLESNGNNAFVEWRYLFGKELEERRQLHIDQKTLADITNALGNSVGIIDR